MNHADLKTGDHQLWVVSHWWLKANIRSKTRSFSLVQLLVYYSRSSAGPSAQKGLGYGNFNGKTMDSRHHSQFMEYDSLLCITLLNPKNEPTHHTTSYLSPIHLYVHLPRSTLVVWFVSTPMKGPRFIQLLHYIWSIFDWWLNPQTTLW